MSKYDKLVLKLLSRNGTFTFQELEYLLGKLGYIEKATGKTSGSRKAYVIKKTKHIIRLHKPHPGNELKKYVVKFVISELRRQKLI